MVDICMLGTEVAKRRRKLNLTQSDLARRARVSRATLDAFENRRLGELGFWKLTRILATLGLELKLQEARAQRPTLEQLREENEDDQSLD